jgi:hypothetical protein
MEEAPAMQLVKGRDDDDEDGKDGDDDDDDDDDDDADDASSLANSSGVTHVVMVMGGDDIGECGCLLFFASLSVLVLADDEAFVPS